MRKSLSHRYNFIGMERELSKHTPLKHQADSEKREKILLEGLKEKVDVVKEGASLLYGVSMEKDLGTVRKGFDTFLASVRARYPDAVNAAQELARLPEELEEFYFQSDAAAEKKEWEISNEEERLSVRDVDYRLVLREARINKLENNPDVMFLMRMERGTALLKEKNEFVHNLYNNREAIINDLFTKLNQSSEGRKIALSEDNIKKISYGPFSIIVKINLDSPFMPPAFHIKNTPFILIKEQEKNSEAFWNAALAHEEIHNKLDGFSSFSLYPSEFLKTFFQSEGRAGKIFEAGWIKEEEMKKIIEELRRRKEEVLYNPLFPKKLIDMLHEEMIADIPSIEAHLLEAFFDKKEKRSKRLGFSTSAREVEIMKKIVSRAGKNEPEKEIKERYEIIKNRIEDAFNMSMRQMRELLFVSLQFPDIIDVHILLILLPPSKFSHIKEYMKFFYGDDVYENFAKSYNQYNQEVLN